ncbi:hypothetical protein LTR22_025387 [Elasticomyces elasticus]|nr:hypothetical protein LTR22_025387 [Elasticomyces elasticus]KAK4900484.1 hypothetical protein LTR49_027430 [Elasticomyces elasticus]
MSLRDDLWRNGPYLLVGWTELCANKKDNKETKMRFSLYCAPRRTADVIIGVLMWWLTRKDVPMPADYGNSEGICEWLADWVEAFDMSDAEVSKVADYKYKYD